MAFHLPTMLATFAVCIALLGSTLALVPGLRRAPGASEAALAAACTAAGCGLLVMDSVLEVARVVPAHALLWFGAALGWQAWRRFDDPRAEATVPIWTASLSVGAFTAVWGSGASHVVQGLLGALVMFVLAAGASTALLFKRGLPSSRLLGIGAAVTTSALQGLRAWLLVDAPDGTVALAQGVPDQWVGFGSSVLFVFGAVLSLVLMHVERVDAQARAAAGTDPVTGCLNRRALAARAEQELSHMTRSGGTMAVVLADLDGFRTIREAHGVSVEDPVLCHVAEVLKEGVRTSDMVARLEGSDFCILLRDADAPIASMLAERLRLALRGRPLEVGGGFVRLTASFGVVVAQKGETWDDLYPRAHRARVAAKDGGRDRVVVA